MKTTPPCPIKKIRAACAPAIAKLRLEYLEYLRGELRAERISYGELAELQDLAPHIAPHDVELLDPAGVPEFQSRYLAADARTKGQWKLQTPKAYLAAIGRKGGSKSTRAKAAAARVNGRKGGRPVNKQQTKGSK